MNTKKRLLTIITLLLPLVMAVIVYSFITSQSKFSKQPSGPLKPLAQWTDDLVLANNELPSGWSLGDVTSKNVPGPGSRLAWFEYFADRSKNWLYISEVFGLYSSSIEATKAYTSWLEVFFPTGLSDGWQVASDLEFTSHADQILVVCSPSIVNAMSFRDCSVLARYQNLIVLILGSVFDKQWLTATDFHNVLEVADRRIAIVLQQ